MIQPIASAKTMESLNKIWDATEIIRTAIHRLLDGDRDAMQLILEQTAIITAERQALVDALDAAGPGAPTAEEESDHA